MDYNIRLINEVKKYTMLYNMNSQGYFNVQKKERVWMLIAKRLDSDVNVCKSKWKSLRDMYMRFKKRLDSGKAPANNRHWKYYEMLDFLTQYNSKNKLTDWERVVGEDKDGKKLDNVNRLIEEIKRYPDLYDKSARGYVERDGKEKIWKEISERMQIDVFSCKLKWKGLRDSFKRFQKRSTRPDAPKWKYYDSLLFLNECNSASTTIKDEVRGDNDAFESSMEEEFFKESKDFRDWETSTQINSDGLLTNNTYRLIEEVRKQPIIYSRRSNFEDKEACENAWKIISEELQIDAPACKLKWKELRDAFLSIKPTKTPCKWQYYENMKFLDDYLEGTIVSGHNSTTSDPLDCDDRQTDYDNDNDSKEIKPLNEEVHLDNNMVTEEYLTIDQIIDTQAMENKQYILSIPESNGEDFVALDIQNSATFAIEEYNLHKSRPLPEQTDVPILYLREDDDEDSNDFLSFAETPRKLLKQAGKDENFVDLFKRSMEEYSKQSSASNEPQSKDSVDILFGSLAYSIKNANLAEDKLMALQANICAYAYGQLAELKKNNESL